MDLDILYGISTTYNKMILSKSFTLNELTKSQEALRLGIENIPNEEHIENLKYFVKKYYNL